MNIAQYLDSTYLKTPEQSGLSEEETLQKDKNLAQEAIDNGIFAVMIRPDYVSEIKKYIQERNSNVVVGTVIGFHEGTYSLDEKLAEALKAIADGAILRFGDTEIKAHHTPGHAIHHIAWQIGLPF